MSQYVTGTFEIKVVPEAQAEAPQGGVPTGRLGLSKTFTGALEGTAKGTMITAASMAPGAPTTYVAIDQFYGKLNGRTGGFVFTHRGTMTKDGKGVLDIQVSPDSGTGELEGIAGTMTIEVKDGRHVYGLTYALPPTT